MSEEKDLQSRLLQLHYGLLGDEETRELEAKIASDPACAAAWEETSKIADLIKVAAIGPQTVTQLRFEAPSESERPQYVPKTPISRWRRWSGRAGILAGIAASLLFVVAVFDLVEIQQESTLPGRLLVAAPAELDAAAPQQVTMKVIPSAGETLPAEVDVTVTDAVGKPVLQWSEETDEEGAATVALPTVERPGGNFHLVVASKRRPELRVAAELPVKAEDPWLSLSTDLKSYAPGSTVYYRALGLYPITSRPIESSKVTFRIEGPDGGTLPGSAIATTFQNGSAGASYQLPKIARPGPHTLVASIDHRPVARRSFVVGETAELETDGMEKVTSETVNPAAAEQPPRLEIELRPAAGTLVAGVKSEVYFTASDPAGRPVEVRGRLVTDIETVPVESTWEGMGRWSYVPHRGAQSTLEIDEPLSMSVALPRPWADEDVRVPKIAATFTVAARVLEPDADLQVSVHSLAASQALAIGVTRRGVTVGQVAIPAGEGTEKITIPLPEAASGALRVTLYDYDHFPPRPVASELVYRKPPGSLHVDSENVKTDRDGTLNVRLTIRDETGAPAKAVLQLSEDPIGLPARYYLADEIDVRPGLDLDAYLEEQTPDHRHLGLLLGARGKVVLSSHSERSAYAANLATAPQIFDSLETAIDSDTSEAMEVNGSDTFAYIPWIRTIAIAGGLVIAVLACGALLVDARRSLPVWLPTLSVAAATVLIGVMLGFRRAPDRGAERMVAYATPPSPPLETTELSGPSGPAMPPEDSGFAEGGLQGRAGGGFASRDQKGSKDDGDMSDPKTDGSVGVSRTDENVASAGASAAPIEVAANDHATIGAGLDVDAVPQSNVGRNHRLDEAGLKEAPVPELAQLESEQQKKLAPSDDERRRALEDDSSQRSPEIATRRQRAMRAEPTETNELARLESAEPQAPPAPGQPAPVPEQATESAEEKTIAESRRAEGSKPKLEAKGALGFKITDARNTEKEASSANEPLWWPKILFETDATGRATLFLPKVGARPGQFVRIDAMDAAGRLGTLVVPIGVPTEE